MDVSQNSELIQNWIYHLLGEYLERGENGRSYWKAAMQVKLSYIDMNIEHKNLSGLSKPSWDKLWVNHQVNHH